MSENSPPRYEECLRVLRELGDNWGVAAAILVTPRLGAGLTYTLVSCGQLLAALLLDQWGLIGLPTHHAGPVRILGVVLLLAGAALIRLF